MSVLSGWLAAARLLRRHLQDRLSVSYISVGEIYDGMRGSPDPERELDVARTTLVPFELLIAATALVHGPIIITGNRRHFQRIPSLMLEGVEQARSRPHPHARGWRGSRTEEAHTR